MKKHIYILMILLASTWSGCKKDYLELSTNPDLPITANAPSLLAGALKTTAGILNGNIRTVGVAVPTDANYTMYAAWIGYVSWSTGYQANANLVQYAFTNANYDVWTRLYLNLSNYNALSKATTNPYYLAMAKIMTAFDFQQLVDNYNDVPYTEVFQGTAMLNPHYDKGPVIYADLMKQLDAAIVMIQTAPADALKPGSDDIMYQGVMSDWVKFANTLKLRLAIRQSNQNDKLAGLKTAISATEALGYINGDNPATVNPGYLNSDVNDGQQSPLWDAYGTTQSGSSHEYRKRYYGNQYAIDFYVKTNDPRALWVYALNSDGVLHSTYLGETAPQSQSRIGKGALKSPTMDAVILSGAESLFLQAEAASTGLIGGNAQSLYNAGVLASFVDDLVPNAATAAATYTAAPATAYPIGGSLAQQQKAIIVQKWAALNPYGAFEAFNEYRRTGYPDDIPLSVFPGANPPNQVTRILYPTIEYQTNAANVAAEGPIDKFTSKIFWAK